jgi:non-specific serine/threonine protein kinase
VSRTTVQRWERGERAPDSGAEAALLAYCRQAGLFRTFDRGPLAGLTLTEEGLRDLFGEARWRGGSREASARSPTSPVKRAAGGPEGEPPGSGPTTADSGPPPAVDPRIDASEDGSATAGEPAPPPPAPPTNLPLALTSFVGRERELAAVRRVQAGTRLLTLTGPGGGGKTRLALALAGEVRRAYPQGIWFVNLAPLTDPALVPQVVASALGFRLSGPQPLAEVLAEALGLRHLLLVLDNCEHLLPDCAVLVEALLRACANLEVVATSREPLGIGGETIWRVPPLALPEVTGNENPKPQVDALLEYDAVRLFVERARLQRPDFALSPDNVAAAVAICRRVDGMPLAIELAAARVNVLSLDQIEERLRDRFQLLTSSSRTALPRHQTLRAALDWSYDLLAEPERILFRRLSVFVDSLTLEAAETVCIDEDSGGQTVDESSSTAIGRSSSVVRRGDVLDLLSQLVDKSLVQVEEAGGDVRFRLLETVREYGRAALIASGEAAAIQERHAAYFLTHVEQVERWLFGADQSKWLERIERDHDNLRAALGWYLAPPAGGRGKLHRLGPRPPWPDRDAAGGLHPSRRVARRGARSVPQGR